MKKSKVKGRPLLERLIQYGLIAIILGTALLNGGGAFFETRVLLYVLALFLVIVWLLKGVGDNQFIFPRTDIDIPAVLFLLVAAASSYKLLNLHASLDSGFLILSYLLFYWLVVGNVKEKERIYFFVVIIVLTGFALACLGIYQYVFGYKLLVKWAEAGNLTLPLTPDRASSVFISPNHLAVFLSMILGVIFVWLVNAEKWWQRILVGVVGVVLGICLYLTFSRGGWISFGLIMVILWLGLGRKKWLKTSLVLIIMIGLVLPSSIAIFNYTASVSPRTTGYTAQTTAKAAGTSLSGRFLLWEGTLKMIKSAPWSGKGIGTFPSTYPIYQAGGLYSQYAHNAYLQIFAETGILGFVLFLAVFFLILRRQYLVFARTKDDFLKGLSLAFLAGSAGFAFHNLADFSWQIAGVAIVFWSFAALSVCIERAEEGVSGGGRSLVFKGRLLKIISLAVILPSLVAIAALVYSLGGFLSFEQGRALFKEKDFHPAFHFLYSAVKWDPIAADYRHELAKSYQEESEKCEEKEEKEKLLLEAITHSKKAVALEPLWARHHSQLGLLYWKAKEFSKAEAELKQSKKLYPNEPYFPVILGKFYLSQNRSELAVAEFNRAVWLEKYYHVWYPEEALANISDAYVNLGNERVKKNKIAKALSYYNKAIKLNPKNSAAYFNRGWLYHQEGSFDKALADYKRAAELNPEYGLIHFNMGLLYERIGKLERAAVEFEKVVKLEPKNEEVKTKLKQLRERQEG